MIEQVIEKWHAHLRGQLPGGLDELLDDDVVFYSPIVYTPAGGQGDHEALPAGRRPDAPGRHDGLGPAAGTASAAASGGGFRYTKTVLTGDTAVLEFETTVEGKYVNGVDIIRCNDAGPHRRDPRDDPPAPGDQPRAPPDGRGPRTDEARER